MNFAQLLDPFSSGALNPMRALRGPHRFFDLAHHFAQFPFRGFEGLTSTSCELRPRSVATRVLKFIRHQRHPVGLQGVKSTLRIHRVVAATALYELLQRGEIERTNGASPYLYRVAK